MDAFEKGWPEEFYSTIQKKVKTMIVNKKSVKAGDIEVYNTEIIHTRVMCILTTNRIKLDEVLKYQLSPIPNSLIRENGNMRLAKSKSTLKNNL